MGGTFIGTYYPGNDAIRTSYFDVHCEYDEKNRLKKIIH